MRGEFKPMLAGTWESGMTLKYPVWASSKLDGVRAVIRGGVLYSRNLKPIPNKELQARYGKSKYNGLDGELICGNHNAKDVFTRTMSAVMSEESDDADHVDFWVFDDFTKPDLPYHERQAGIDKRVVNGHQFMILKQWVFDSDDELNEFEETSVNTGFEGIMVRDPMSVYKYGRATAREATLLKVKRFADAEAIIVDIEPLYRNNNEAKTDELGRSKRSSHKENLVALPMLGNMQVLGDGGKWDKVMFGIGSGFTDKQRKEFWETRSKLRFKRVVYKYFESGSKDAPRFPVFKAFRPEGA